MISYFTKKIFLGTMLNIASLYALTRLVDGVEYTGGYLFFIVGGLIIGMVNSMIKPLLKLISAPVIVITLGLFSIVINALSLWLLSYFLSIIQFRDVALTFPNFGTYAIGALVFALINWASHIVFRK
ncbi:phage holin family protein [Candidatus Peregrinibacteria bacterium]|jgi:putative membrane protein|nr:phage holin family protein [Candidatus Peregrinibacteria bacterium]MBT4056403.1 phage holin family protein [Candidatus Peregrinibacteria bacterium]